MAWKYNKFTKEWTRSDGYTFVTSKKTFAETTTEIELLSQKQNYKN